VAVSPLGNAVYALNGADGTVSQYTLRTGSGILAPMTPATVPTDASASTPPNPSANPIAMAINSAGTFAYVVNQGDNSVSEFSIARGSGTLTFVTTTMTGYGPNAVAISPNGRYLYVTNGIDATISEFSITSGALTALPESPASINSGQNTPTSVVVDPSNTYVYVSDSSNIIDGYTISTTDGFLSANTAGGTTGTDATSNKLAFDQTGMFLFSADNDGNVDEFALTPPTGVLVPVGTYMSPSGGNATSIATANFPPR
jgi:6-phosphogluconolactonase (cycloisomerase 2 family)